MTTKFVIRLRLAQLSDAALLTFSQTVTAMMTGNSSYTTPSPTLIVLGTLTTDFSDALTAWGTTGNRGSHSDHYAVLNTRAALENGLTALAKYCENTTPNNAAAFVSGGFEVKDPASPVGILQAVENFHQFLDRKVNFNEAKLRWKKPLDTPRGAVKVYHVYRNSVAVFNTATLVGSVTKTTFTDSDLTNPFYFYWVVPIGAAGPGVISDICMATVALQPL